jgi:myo-inositol 2-dehydrogenase/D-chiro-inositol 1-dehydrogenase
MIRVENPKPHQALLSTAAGDQAPPLLHFFMERYTDSYVRELSAFIEAVRGGKEPPVTGRDGKIPVVMGYAAKRSLAEGRPIHLSEIDPVVRYRQPHDG